VRINDVLRGLAVHRRRHALGLEHRAAARAADQHSQKTLIGGDLGGIAAQTGLIVLGDQCRQHFLHGTHEQLRAQLDIRAKPLGQYAVDIGQTEIGHGAGRQ